MQHFHYTSQKYSCIHQPEDTDFFAGDGALKYELNYFFSVQIKCTSVLLLRVNLEAILSQHSLFFPHLYCALHSLFLCMSYNPLLFPQCDTLMCRFLACCKRQHFQKSLFVLLYLLIPMGSREERSYRGAEYKLEFVYNTNLE